MSQVEAKRSNFSKEIVVGWVSSSVEAYNMAIYSFTAPLLAGYLFQNTSSALFFSYALLFFATCIFYPLGALYYGFLGDKKGRQKTCIYSALGLGIATGMMGIIPFDMMPRTAWACFLLLISFQHFFSGGEYHGSIVFSLEHGQEKQKGFMSSLSCLFAVFGLVSANGFATLAQFTQQLFVLKLCFLIGALGGCVSYFLKNHCKETPAFIASSKERVENEKWSQIFYFEWKKILNVIFVYAAFLVSYTYIFIFLPLLHFEQANVLSTFSALILYGVFLVIAGFFADIVGIEKMIFSGLVFFALTSLPLCYYCHDLFLLQVSLTVSAACVIGPIHSWMLHQFEVRRRCRGIFVSSAIATSVFGGSTAPICLLIFEKTNSLPLTALYPLTIFLCALFFLSSRIYFPSVNKPM